MKDSERNIFFELMIFIILFIHNFKCNFVILWHIFKLTYKLNFEITPRCLKKNKLTA
jgi:hypothetical protein